MVFLIVGIFGLGAIVCVVYLLMALHQYIVNRYTEQETVRELEHEAKMKDIRDSKP